MDVIGAETLKRMETVPFYNDLIFKQFKSLLRGNILEIGCGIGSFTKEMLRFGSVTAVDIEEEYIRKTKLKTKNKASVGFGDIEKGTFFFRKRNFDTIVCLNVLEHIHKDQDALKNIYKLLNPQGRVFLLTPAHPTAYGEIDKGLSHFRRYTKKSLSNKFRKAGFAVETVYYFNAVGIFGWFLNSRVLKRKILPSNQLVLFRFLAKPILFIEKFIKPPFGLSVCLIATK